MQMRKSMVTAGLAITLCAGSLFAALSPEHVAFGKSAAKFLMTTEEAAKWKSLSSDRDAQRFEELFWARRDPTPGTAANEFRDEFEARVKFADERYGFGKVSGSVSDRGRIIVLLGPPTRVMRSHEVPSPNIQQGVTAEIGASSSPGGGGGTVTLKDMQPPTETWLYERDRIPTWAGTQPLEIPFVDQYGSQEWKIGRSDKTNVNELMKMAAQVSLTQPNLTEVPKMAAASAASPVQAVQTNKVVTATVPAPEVTAPTMTTFKTQSLQTAVDEFKTARTSPYKNVYVTYAPFVTAAGEYFVPVQLYLPKSSGLTTEQALTFFGVVQDPAGKVVTVYEEPARLTATKEDTYFDKSLMLTPGKYTATFGLAADGKPVTMATVNLDLDAIEKGTEGVSPLFLSNNIEAMKTAQNPTDPFAFGGLKVVPKGDRLFRTDEELGYFVEIRNPGLDATGNPKFQMGMLWEATVDTVQNGKTVKVTKKMQQPLQEAVMIPVKGVPGQYQTGGFIPLSVFGAGEYKIKMKILDTVSKQTYNRDATFRLVKAK